MKALTDHQISVIGAGAWGTTLANLLAEKKYQVKIWAFEEKTVKHINLNRENYIFLPGVKLSEYLHAYNDFKKVVLGADILISAIPSQYVREVTKKYTPYLRNDKQIVLVSVSKGIEHQTFKLMTQVLREIMEPNVRIAALSGPNHAEEVARKMPTATVIASIDEDILDELVNVFRTPYFVPYALNDEIGGGTACLSSRVAASVACEDIPRPLGNSAFQHEHRHRRNHVAASELAAADQFVQGERPAR